MDFIIKKPTSSNRTVRMPDTLIEKITELAARMDVSFNQVVVQCCEYAIENLPICPACAGKINRNPVSHF